MQHASIPDRNRCEDEVKTWNGPKYIIGYPNQENPFVPYYCIAGDDVEWVSLPQKGCFYYDPIEDCAEFSKINQIVEQMVDEELGEQKLLLGVCHRAWSIKKRILKEKYGIEWHSISELNPGCNFD